MFIHPGPSRRLRSPTTDLNHVRDTLEINRRPWTSSTGVRPAVREMPPAKTANPSQTPGFTARQIYLKDPPADIGQFDQLKLRYTQGLGVIVADCE